ncbi:MAG: DUF429 domain-containing protein [Betaproteobacteria bacterium]|nr:DUF429 domain-containing protein [Betaproteobacteria bacterium]
MSEASRKRATASLQIMGIHVGGVSSHKTSLVRGRCVLKEIQSGLSDALLHRNFCERIRHSLGDIASGAVGVHFENDSSTKSNSPLFWETFSTELGPAPHADADTHLLQAISDHGGADVFCLDAPITFPTCTNCSRVCPGVLLCPEPAVQGMMRLWNEDKQSEEKRPRMPFPHTERFFETYARRRYENSSFAGAVDLENALSSNRAPLSARAHHLARRLLHNFPNAIVVETHPWLAATGWALHSGYRLNHVAELRQPDSGRVSRAGLLKRLEMQRVAMRSPTFIEDLFVELSEHVELFAACMAALSAWGLLNGLCDIQPSFLEQEHDDLLKGWALVPRELATYGWGH